MNTLLTNKMKHYVCLRGRLFIKNRSHRFAKDFYLIINTQVEPRT